MGVNEAKTAILENRTALGIEFGSTRIKAVLVDDKNQPIASGAYEWENQYVDGIWTYSLEEIWKGLQGSYQDMAEDVQKKAAEFATISQNMAQKDPQKFASVMQELQPELRSLQGSNDNDKLCRFYDKAIVKMK